MANVFQDLGRTFGSMSEIWLAVAYVVSMFVVLAFRQHQIADLNAFRLSYKMFALYLVLPAIAEGILRLINAGSRQGTMPSMSMASPGWMQTAFDVTITIVAKGLLAGSICYGMSSLLRGRALGEVQETPLR
jgi:hypothetical protein